MSGLFFESEAVHKAREILEDVLKEERAPEWRRIEARTWLNYCTTRRAKRPDEGSQAPDEVIIIVSILTDASPHRVAVNRRNEAIESRPQQRPFEVTAHP